MAVESKELPQRAELPEQDTWALEDLYADHEQWEKDFVTVKELTKTLESFSGTLTDSPSKLLEALQLKDKIGQLIMRLFAYARMRKDEDNSNTTYQALTDRAQSLLVQVQESSAFFTPELLAVPEEKLKIYLQDSEELRLYEHYLDDILREKDHVLSVEQERLLAAVGDLADSPQAIYGMLNHADIRFPKIKAENGEEITVTMGRYIQLLESKDRRVRKDAFQAVYSTYENHKNTIAAIYQASVKKDVFYARARHYESALSMALEEDNIPSSVYDNLISAVHENLDSMYRYVRLRKKLLGVDELHMYDLFAPMVKDIEYPVSYQEAKDTIVKGLQPLGDEYVRVLQEAFGSRWIDVHENQGKTSGAYSWGAYGVHPFVLMNYQESVNDMFTLAHEMGHAMHSYYSHKTQPFVYSGYTIFVAEVASTVNESLLMQHLLATTTDPKRKMHLLNHYVEQFRTTVFRQTMFAEFEKMTHEKVEAGIPLTPELLSDMYYELNQKYYGPDMVADTDIRMEWARIPHFYRAFYVYKYATGFSAATAITKRIKEQGEPAIQDYLKFLKGGSSKYSIDLLKEAGVDMTSPQPVNAGLSVFADLVTQLEELAEQL